MIKPCSFVAVLGVLGLCQTLQVVDGSEIRDTTPWQMPTDSDWKWTLVHQRTGSFYLSKGWTTAKPVISPVQLNLPNMRVLVAEGKNKLGNYSFVTTDIASYLGPRKGCLYGYKMAYSTLKNTEILFPTSPVDWHFFQGGRDDDSGIFSVVFQNLSDGSVQRVVFDPAGNRTEKLGVVLSGFIGRAIGNFFHKESPSLLLQHAETGRWHLQKDLFVGDGELLELPVHVTDVATATLDMDGDGLAEVIFDEPSRNQSKLLRRSSSGSWETVLLRKDSNGSAAVILTE